MRRSSKIFLTIALALVSLTSQATLLTMDEVPTQAVDGLSVSGVTFEFTVAGINSTDADYNSGGPGDSTYLQGAMMEGNSAGILGMTFDVATSNLSFGLALSLQTPLIPGAVVELFDINMQSIGTFNLDTTPLVSFTEGQFNYSGVDILRATVDFDDNAGRFAFDNLAFNQIPEPGALALLLLGAGVLARRQRV